MAQSIPFTTGASPDLLNKAIQNIWLKVKDVETDHYKKYYNVVTGVTDYYTKDSSLSGMGLASRILDNAVITAESPIEGYDQTYTQVHYGKLLRVSKMMWFFGIKKRDLTRITSQVRQACSRHRETLCADRLDNSFSTSYTKTDDSGSYTVTTTGGNGVELVSNAQTREDGGTNNNNRVTDGTTVNFDFAYDAVKAVQYTASTLSPIKDAKGQPMNINPDTFVFTKGSPESFIAQEILGAIRRGHKPNSAEYDGSGVPAFKTIELPWITTNTSYWWAFDSSMVNDQYGLQYFESQPIKLEGPNVVFTTKEIQYTATYMAAIGHNDYRGWQGSKNTNAA
jgi:hypothetical protein